MNNCKLPLLLIALIFFAKASFATGLNSFGQSFNVFEIVAESDGTNDLSGFHFLRYFKPAGASKIRGYFGGGPVYVKLPEANDEFPAIHALTGADLKLNRLLALNAEFSFDLVEEILIDDRGSQDIYYEQSNKIDIGIALGVVFTIDRSLYAKFYYRHHIFDGVYLPETKVDFTGLRIGFRF